jgi:hypothetical protein
MQQLQECSLWFRHFKDRQIFVETDERPWYSSNGKNVPGILQKVETIQ